MTEGTKRSIFRWVHIICGIPILGYIYRWVHIISGNPILGYI
jgi:hypothetical protein